MIWSPTGRKCARVDDQFAYLLNGPLWDVNGYLVTYHPSKPGILIGISRIIKDFWNEGLVIDHINGDTYDNCLANLRIATTPENAYNRQKPRRRIPTDSVYKGVFLNYRGQWAARITCNKKTYILGTFASEMEAAIAYNQAAANLFGAFARFNPITPCILNNKSITA